MFGFSETGSGFVPKIVESADRKLVLGARSILEELGFGVEEVIEGDWLDEIMERFGDSFPTTAEFSSFARETIVAVPDPDDPDGRLLAWLEHEEMLFRTLEKYIVEERMRLGFTGVDDLLSYTLGVQNRRKSRAGHGLSGIWQRYLTSSECSALTAR